jgi:predicted phosphohydrolase
MFTLHFLTDSTTKSYLKLAWSTDLHLDAADKSQHHNFFDGFKSDNFDAILISGDISNGANSLLHLKHLGNLIQKPIYFVLGNHDYYYGSIYKIRTLASEINRDYPLIHYLTSTKVLPLASRTALVGHDGWADGRAGDYFNSNVLLNDYFYIEELKNLNPAERLQVLHDLGDEAAKHLKEILPLAFTQYDKVILLTHVPPFEEVCFYEGKVCGPNWSPHFVGEVIGETLIDIMQLNPTKNVLVLCGHSHSPADVQILPNLRVIAGESELGIPQVQGVIYVD